MLGKFGANLLRIAGINGNVADVTGSALNVNASVSPVPVLNAAYTLHRVLRSGSDDLRASATLGSPINCDWTVPGGETWYVEAITFWMADAGTSVATAYGSISGGLPNGCLLQVQSNGTLYTLATINNNMHLMLTFQDSGMITPTAGFIETADVYTGTIRFNTPMKLTGGTGDFVRFKLQDNVSTLDQQKLWVKAWKVV